MSDLKESGKKRKTREKVILFVVYVFSDCSRIDDRQEVHRVVSN